MTPLHGTTPRGRRHGLIQCKCFRIPIRCLRREGASKTLKLSEQLNGPLTALTCSEATAGCKRTGICCVELEGCPISAVFIEENSAHEQHEVRGLGEFHAPVEGSML